MNDLTHASVTQGCGPKLPRLHGHDGPLRQRIFEYVRGEGRTARAEISRALEISPGSATTVTADLIGMGLLREVSEPPKETARGRPRVDLEIVPDAGFVIGIKLSDERHTAVLTDLSGQMIADTALRAPLRRCSLDEVMGQISALLSKLLMGAGKTVWDINAVGIGISGIVDHEAGCVSWSPLLEGRDNDLRTAFETAFGLPVYIDNDANMLTLAELWFGVGRDMTDFAVVTIENGVGMGLVLNNRLFRGTLGMGMELGHTKVQLDGALCRCGQRGCLEAYLADYALAREAATALDQHNDAEHSPQTMLQDLFEQAKAGHTAARLIFERAGRYMAVGLSNVIQLFDPALIILSGERMQYDYLYADKVLKEIHTLTLQRGRTPCRIENHAWGDLVWARGATALALSALTNSLLGATDTA